MSSKKQIIIDHTTLGGGQSSNAHKTTMKQRKTKPVVMLRPNTVKKNLLEKIKDFKRRNEETPLQSQPVQSSLSNHELANQFKMSSSYLEQLINKKKEARKPNKPKQQPVMQPIMQPIMQPMQPVMQPVMQPIMQPMQPIMQPMQPIMQPMQPIMQPMQPIMQPMQAQLIEVSLDLPPELQMNPFNPIFPKPMFVAPIAHEEPVSVAIAHEEPVSVAIAHEEPVSVAIAHEEPVSAASSSHSYNPIVLKEVPYGCLRNGNKPTYRTYHRKLQPEQNPSHNNTMKKHHSVANPNPNPIPTFNPNINPEEDAMIQERQRKLRELQEKAGATNATNPSADDKISHVMKIKNKIRQTTTKKYKLGRTPGSNVVGVLIKNNDTRSLITNELGVLKRESILEIRKYLHNHGLLKVGSDAPPDVLRNMYETAKLTGEVNNVNKQVMLHNFIATADKGS
jgi:hypothetical protein